MKSRLPSGPVTKAKVPKGFFLLKMASFYRDELTALASELGIELRCALYHAVLREKADLLEAVRLKRRMGTAYDDRDRVFKFVHGQENN